MHGQSSATGRLTDSDLFRLAAVQPSLALYVHVPFCASRCAYCAFHSQRCDSTTRVAEYSNRLMQRLQSLTPLLNRVSIRSAYIGGGDPSVLPFAVLKELGSQLRHIGGKNMELTMEGSPPGLMSLGTARLSELALSRLSAGVQSFSPDIRKLLGRTHTASAAYLSEMAHMMRAQGGDLALDLMYGFAGDTPSRLAFDIDKALYTGATHLSIYDLTIRPGGIAHSLSDRRLQHASRASSRRLHHSLRRTVREAGLYRYEVSNYSYRGGRASVHNAGYWEYLPYLGLGSGAASMLYADPEHAASHGVVNTRETAGGLIRTERLNGADTLGELLLSGVRWRGGVNVARVHNHLRGLQISLPRAIQCFEAISSDLIEQGLLVRDAYRIRVPESRWNRADEVALALWEGVRRVAS